MLQLETITEAEIEAFTWELVQALPAGMLEDPASERHALAIMDALALVLLVLEQQLQRLPELRDPESCPDAAVPLLAALVGLDAAVPPVGSATADVLRRLIPNAIRRWRSAGTREAQRSVLRAFTGRRSVFLDWHDRKAAISSGVRAELVVLPDPRTAPGGAYSWPEFTADVVVHDPEGTADLELSAAWVRLFLQFGARLNLIRALLAEDFQLGLGLWTTTGAPQLGAGVIEVPAGGGLLADVGGLAPTWGDYTLHVRAQLAGGDGTVVVAAAADGSAGYHVNLDPAARELHVSRVTAGVPTLLQTFPAPWLGEDGPVDVRVGLSALEAATELAIVLDGELLGRVTDSHASRRSTGTVGVLGGAGTVHVQGVLVVSHRPDVVHVRAA